MASKNNQKTKKNWKLLYFIKPQKVLKALGKHWHPEHFQCKICKTRIGDSTFKEKDGLPVCLKCWADKFVPICFHCNDKILEVSVLKLQLHYYTNFTLDAITKQKFLCKRRHCTNFAFLPTTKIPALKIPRVVLY